MKRPYDPRIPSILMEFNWPKKEQYPSFLEIESQFTPKSDVVLERLHISRFPWEKELGLESFERIENRIARPSARNIVVDNDSV